MYELIDDENDTSIDNEEYLHAYELLFSNTIQKCNFKKGNKVLKNSGLHLFRKPEAPNTWILQQNGRAFPPNYLHESWRDYLYWDTELEI